MMQLPTASAIPGPAWRLLQKGKTRAVPAHFREAEPLPLPPHSQKDIGPGPSPVPSVRAHRGSGESQKCPSAGQGRAGGQQELGRQVPAVLPPGLQRRGERNFLPAANSLKQHSAPVQPKIQLLLQPDQELFPTYLRHG